MKDIKTKERRSARATDRNSSARKLSAACRKIAFVGIPLMRLYCRDGNSLNSLMPHYGERPHVLRQTANDPPTTFLESAAVGSPADSTLAREKDPFLIPRRVSPLIVFTFREATPFAFHTLRHEIHLAIREIPTIRQTLDIHPYIVRIALPIYILTTFRNPCAYRICMYFMLMPVMRKVSLTYRKKMSVTRSARVCILRRDGTKL